MSRNVPTFLPQKFVDDCNGVGFVECVFCGTGRSLPAGIPMANLIFADYFAGLGLVRLPLMVYHPLPLLICTPLADQWAKGQARAHRPPSVLITHQAAS